MFAPVVPAEVSRVRWPPLPLPRPLKAPPHPFVVRLLRPPPQLPGVRVPLALLQLFGQLVPVRPPLLLSSAALRLQPFGPHELALVYLVVPVAVLVALPLFVAPVPLPPWTVVLPPLRLRPLGV